MENWYISAKRADFKAIAARFGIDQVTARLIRNRELVGVDEIEKYLNATPDDLHSPSLMKDMEKACGIIERKIQEHKKIRVIGDYDVDGIMSTYILITGLKRLGAVADERIPERIRDGYGLNESLVRQAYEDGADTILTCDNGISAAEQIDIAKDLQMTVVVTDHHEVPRDEKTGEQIISAADAVVNPKQDECSYPFTGICGAVIAWKLITLLYERNGIPKSESDAFLPFAAIATICDVCELKDENRIIVKYGLPALGNCTNPGLNALLSLNNLDARDISVYHVGFVIGPCLNASGRLDTAERALSLLFCKDNSEAVSLASELISMNTSRKEMTEEYTEKACEIVEGSSLINDHVLVVYLPDCHESLAGIIAGRLRERYNKPAFVLTDSADGVKGSGRSTDEYSMYEELSKCRSLLLKFGGHPKAAGLSMLPENVDTFRADLNGNCSLTDEDLIRKIHVDMTLPLGYISQKLIEEFELLAPFGVGNPRPLFAQKDLRVIQPGVFGKNRNVVRMRLADSAGVQLSAVYFGAADEFCEYVHNHETISAVFYPAINTFRGVSSVQLTITNYQ